MRTLRGTDRRYIDMAQHEVELILMKQVASYLATPIFLVNSVGDLLYYNEPAEAILGTRYDETGELPLDGWASMFAPRAVDGGALAPDQLPLVVALREQRPAHGTMSICGLDGVTREISVTAFPLVGQHDRCVGAVAIFWEQVA